MPPLVAGIVLKIASTIAFAFMVTAIKAASADIPAGEVLFARSFFGIVPVIIYLVWIGEFPASLATRNPFGHVRRSLVGTLSMFTWFTGIAHLPLPDATAISYSGPLFGVCFAALLLGEKVRAFRWTAVFVGFVGVLIVLSPHFGDLDHLTEGGAATGAMCCFGSAVFMAFAQIQVRNLTATERTGAIVVYFSIGSALVALSTSPWWVMPSGGDLALLILTGIFGGIGQIFLTLAYRHADASVVAPLEYTSMLWAVVTGWWFFAEWPSLTVLVGSAVIVGSGIAIVWRERAIGIARRDEAN